MASEPDDLAREQRRLQLMERALAVSEEAASAYLDEACGADAELRASVRALIEIANREPELAPQALSPSLASYLEPEADEPPAGDFGAYTVLRPIGSGGMGIVYEARQRSPERSVALKLLRGAHLSPDGLRRFEYEVRALARLRHPGVARIIESGVACTEHGPRPFLVMELIEGARLDQHVAAQRPSRRERLELFERICAAVQHAHQNGVQHCDLKPANILVEADGQPKVLDFGIARVLDEEGRAADTGASEPGRAGTPLYMSPEQAAGAPIDARADVYSLGVILRALLTGVWPRAADATPPTRSASGDLEAIVGRALARQPEDRYASVSELAADVRRHLDHQPVSARRPSLPYVLGKFSRRHRAFVASVVTVSLVLVSALVVALALLERATVQTTKANEINRSFGEILRSADPRDAGRDVTVAQLLGEARERIERDFATRPEVRNFLVFSIGRSYFSLGMYDEAAPLLEEAYLGVGALEGERDLLTVEAMSFLGVVRREQGRFEEAGELLEASRRRYGELLGERDPLTLRARGNLAQLWLDQGRLELCEQEARGVLPLQLEVVGPEHEDLGVTRDTLARACHTLGRVDEAERLLRLEVERCRRRYGAQHAHTVTAENNLVWLLLELDGREEEALQLARGVAERAPAAYGSEHPDTAVAESNLGLAMFGAGVEEGVEEHLRRAADDLARLLGADHWRAMRLRHTLGAYLRRTGRLDEAEMVLAELLAMQRDVLAPGHPDFELILADLALIMRERGELALQAQFLEELLELQVELYGPEGERPLRTRGALEAVTRALEREDG